MTDTQIAVLLATFADRGEAERIARATIEQGLAACANILAPCRSVYRWQGAVEQAEEVPVLFKTAAGLAPHLRDRIASLHSYSLPAIEIIPAMASIAAAGWIAAETRPPEAIGDR